MHDVGLYIYVAALSVVAQSFRVIEHHPFDAQEGFSEL
jgi:hypothetical protein